MRRIAVFTGTRAEFGLLRKLMLRFKNDPEIDLQVIVSGTHTSPEFGETYKEIAKDFFINEQIEMLLSSDSSVGVGKSYGLGVLGYIDALKRLSPEILVILGDRYEALAMATAGFLMKIPIAHINGGDSTVAVLDEGIRHAITKLSQIHFPTSEKHRSRIIQMGENPEMVFNVGSLGVENCLDNDFMDKKTLENDLGISLSNNVILVTFHPGTHDLVGVENQTNELLGAVQDLDQHDFVFTKANADVGGRKVNSLLEKFVEGRRNCHLFSSLGMRRYLSLMKISKLVLGNSSSGLIEAPSMLVPTVNLGDRQKGRDCASSVINCPIERSAIKEAIKLTQQAGWQSKNVNGKNPYGSGNTSTLIFEKLKCVALENILLKDFHEIPSK